MGKRLVSCFFDSRCIMPRGSACRNSACRCRNNAMYPTRTTLLTLVHALVVTKVDYCSSVLSGISGQLLQRLQSVFKAADRLVLSARKSEHITPLLRELHWLKVPERIQFRLCVLAYRCIIGTAPSYLAETLHLTAECRRRFTSASSGCFYIDAGHTVYTTHHAG